MARHDDRTTSSSQSRPKLSRRGLVQGAAALGASVPLGAVFADQVLARGLSRPSVLAPEAPICTVAAPATGALKPIKIAWNAAAVCSSPVAYAREKGIFAKHGIEAELVNFGGSTEQLLEAIATGKADAGVGMALRWLKPMEQGFDVKITLGTHGGCLRLLGSKEAGLTDIKSLKGKTVAVADMAGPAKNFFSILLAKRGINPDTEVTWRQYPGELLPLAVEKGEAHALADNDPRTYVFLKDSKGKLFEVASNLTDEYKDRLCCVVGVRGSLIRSDKPVVSALTRAILEAQHHAGHHPRDAAAAFQQYAPKTSIDDLVAMLNDHTHLHSPVGDALKKEITLYADELKAVSVFKANTDTTKFAERVYADVLS